MYGMFMISITIYFLSKIGPSFYVLICVSLHINELVVGDIQYDFGNEFSIISKPKVDIHKMFI